MAKKPSAKGKGKGSTFDRIVVAGIVIALIAIVLTLWGPLRKFRVAEEKEADRANNESRNRLRKKQCRKQKGNEIKRSEKTR